MSFSNAPYSVNMADTGQYIDASIIQYNTESQKVHYILS